MLIPDLFVHRGNVSYSLIMAFVGSFFCMANNVLETYIRTFVHKILILCTRLYNQSSINVMLAACSSNFVCEPQE